MKKLALIVLIIVVALMAAKSAPCRTVIPEYVAQ